MRRQRVPWAVALGALWLALLPQSAAAQTLDGAALFESGVGRDGREIVGRSGAGEVALRGAAVACANCHGATGAGGGEGWLRAPDVRWFALSKPYGAPRADGSVRPPYDAAALERALRRGIAPDGRRLDPAMPRFDLATDEFAALTAHLRRLDDARPARSPVLLLAVIAPETARSRQRREWIAACHAGYAQRSANPLALRVERFPDAEALAAAIAKADRDGSVAALLAPDLAGHEAVLGPALHRAGIPVIAPLAAGDLGDPPTLRFAFPGLARQAEALARLAVDSSWPLAAILPASDDPSFGPAQSALRTLQQAGVPLRVLPRTATVGHAGALLVLDGGFDVSPLDAGTRLLVPGAVASSALAEAAGRRGLPVHVAFAYPPHLQGQAHPVTAEEATAAVACAFLDQASGFAGGPDDAATWRRSLDALRELSLEGWTIVTARAPSASDVRIVEVDARRP